MPPGNVREPFPSQPIVILEKRSAGVWPIVGGLLVAAAGWQLWSSTIAWSPFRAYAGGVLLAACGGLLVWLGIRVLARPRAALIIDRDGIVPDPRTPAERVLWSDLRGAHLAVVESRSSRWPAPKFKSNIVALELVDPRRFHERLDAGRPKWLGYDSGVRPDHFSLLYDNLATDSSQLMYLIGEGISRQGQPNPDPQPQTVYSSFFGRSPTRRDLLAAAMIVVVIVAVIVFTLPPRWIEAAAGCEVRNRYDGKQWRRTRTTTATWAGPCVDGRAQGNGVLEWFRDGALTVRYEGELSNGRMTGRGALTERDGTRHDGMWKDAELQQGTATYPDGRRYEGRWYKNRWIDGVLTASGGRRLEGRWSEGRLSGRGIAEGPEGRYEGGWSYGKPEGMGVFVTPAGQRYEGKWHDGKPADAGAAVQDVEALECLWSIAAVRFGDRFSHVGNPRCRGR